jgi:hypothetical protein
LAQGSACPRIEAVTKPASEAVAERLCRRLQEHPQALTALKVEFGIERDTAERFRLGLADPYPKRTVASPVPFHQDALVGPVRDSRGRFIKRYVYNVLPGVTLDNRLPHDRGHQWSTGPALTYYSRAASAAAAIFVCGDVVDLWALAGLISGTSLEGQLVLAASTLGSAGRWPEEWAEAAFWSQWKSVYLGTPVKDCRDASGRVEIDGLTMGIARRAQRAVLRVPPAIEQGWSASCVQELSAQSFRQLLTRATPIDPTSLRSARTERFAPAEAVDLTCAHHAGHLYETIRVIEHADSSGEGALRYAHVVVRSDRTLHRTREMPCPDGTPKDDRVVLLHPDGAQLLRKPRASPFSTWRWPSAQAYLDGARSEPLAELLRRAGNHLRASVWLPQDQDYAVLACTIAATFCQQIFDAVPLIFVNGQHGTGKSALGAAVSDLCANSPGAGQVSGATMPRLVDWTNGFLFIDDLERLVTSRKDGSSNINDLIQNLKVSYKKSTAVKYWTNADGGMRVERLKFFGIKMINNTGTIDEILGSRMLTIRTRSMPKHVVLPREFLFSAEERAVLRDQFHTWAFENVARIAHTYASIFPNPTTREEEIAAPLRVVAQLSGDPALQCALDEALRAVPQSASGSPRELMAEAVQHILVQFIRERQILRTTLTIQEVLMRLRLLAEPKSGKASTTEVSEVENPEWVGRQFKQEFASDAATVQRTTMYAMGVRYWALDPVVVDRAVAAAAVERTSLTEESNPRVFCDVCARCDYSGICRMEARKLAGAGGLPREPVKHGPQLSAATRGAELH